MLSRIWGVVRPSAYNAFLENVAVSPAGREPIDDQPMDGPTADPMDGRSDQHADT